MKLTLLQFASLFFAFSAHAQAAPMVPRDSQEWAEIYNPPYKVPTELPVDSPSRKELFEILRGQVDASTRFSGTLKAYRNWAFFMGRTVDANGKSIKHPPMDNDDTVALWLRTKQGWKLVDFSFGHSDAFFIVWPERYGVPRELLGMETEAPVGK